MKTPLPLVLSVLAASGCGPTTFRGLCEQSAAAQCRQFFRCQSSASSLYPDVAACTADLTTRAKCESFEGVDCKLDPAKANACVGDIERAACSTMSFSLPASCTEVSCGTMTMMMTGKVSCRSVSSSGCAANLSRCTDGNTYAISCTQAGACTCSKNGTMDSSFMLASACSMNSLQPLLSSRCNYPLE